MYYRLENLEVISHDNIERLGRIGVHSTDDLLIRGRTPLARDSLSRLSGVSLTEINRLVSISDLLRVNGLSVDLATALVDHAEFRTVQDLAAIADGPDRRTYTQRVSQLPATQERVSGVALFLSGQQLDAASNEHHLDQDLAEASEEATELVPRVVFTVPDDGTDFKDEILAKRQSDDRFSLRSGLVVVGLVLGLVLLLLAFNAFALRQEADESARLNAHLEPVATSIRAYNDLLIQLDLTTKGIAALIVIGASIVTYAIYQVLGRAVNPGLLLLLFNRPAYRQSYKRIALLDSERSKKGARASTVLFAVIGLVLVLVVIRSWHRFPTMSTAEIGATLAPALGVGGVLLGVAASYGYLRFYWGREELSSSRDEKGATRYMIYMAAQLALIPVTIVIFLWITMPMSFGLHHTIYDQFVAPWFTEAFAAEREALDALELTEPQLIDRRTSLSAFWDTGAPRLIESGDIFGPRGGLFDFNEVRGISTGLVVWLFLTALLTLFVLPYISLRGWRRGMLYAAIIIAAFFLENWLERVTPALFSVASASVAYWLIVFVVLLASALFFDFIYDTLTSEDTVCPACEAIIGAESRYCPHCGLAQ